MSVPEDIDILISGYTLRNLARRAASAYGRSRGRAKKTPRWVRQLTEAAEVFDRHAKRRWGEEEHERWTW